MSKNPPENIIKRYIALCRLASVPGNANEQAAAARARDKLLKEYPSLKDAEENGPSTINSESAEWFRSIFSGVSVQDVLNMLKAAGVSIVSNAARAGADALHASIVEVIEPASDDIQIDPQISHEFRLDGPPEERGYILQVFVREVDLALLLQNLKTRLAWYGAAETIANAVEEILKDDLYKLHTKNKANKAKK